MNQKIIGIIVGIVVICVLALGGFMLLNNEDSKMSGSNDDTENKTTTNNQNQGDGNDTTNGELGKVLIVYYSATSNTKQVAQTLAQQLSGDLFEIEPEQEYTSEDLNYGNSDSRVSKEHNDESLRNISLKTTTVPNWENYDTVLIGYPIWWGIAAWPVNSFVKATDFGSKTVIPFCTSASSGLGESGNLLRAEANGGVWKEGFRFNSRPSDSEIHTFMEQIK